MWNGGTQLELGWYALRSAAAVVGRSAGTPASQGFFFRSDRWDKGERGRRPPAACGASHRSEPHNAMRLGRSVGFWTKSGPTTPLCLTRAPSNQGSAPRHAFDSGPQPADNGLWRMGGSGDGAADSVGREVGGARSATPSASGAEIALLNTQHGGGACRHAPPDCDRTGVSQGAPGSTVESIRPSL